jgi:hypothetical protein
MKRVLIVLTVLVMMFTMTAVYANQSNTGCGLGSLIFKGKNGLVSQTFAVTTNYSFGTQTFGITSGTSNCQQFSSIVSNERINIFVSQNLDSLAIDIARGNGEYLNTFAVLMDVREADRAAFYSKLQSNFSRIFTATSITHDQVLRNIETVLGSS